MNLRFLETFVWLARLHSFRLTAVLPPAFVMGELEAGKLQLLQVTHPAPALPLVAAYRRTPGSLLSESVTRLALNVVLEFSLKHGPEFALFPPPPTNPSRAHRRPINTRVSQHAGS